MDFAPLIPLRPVIPNVGLLAYAMASILYLLAMQKSPARIAVGRAAFVLFALATVAVTAALAAAAAQGSAARPGFLLTAAVGWLAILAHARFRLLLIGAFVAPLATLILLLQVFIAPAPLAGVEGQPLDLLVRTHIAMAIFGQAFAIIACAISVLYLWQRYLLKRKLLDQLPQNLPAIDRLEFLLMTSLWSGFVFITLGLLSGAIYTQANVPPPEMRLGYKIAWATAVWIWYLATLLARNVFNRPARRIAQLSLGGFVLLALTFFGMGFFRSLGGA